MIGLDPADVQTFDFVPDLPQDPFDDGVADKEGRLRAAAPEWILEEHGKYREPGDHFCWPHHGHHVPFDLLTRAFSWQEVIRIWLSQCVQGCLSRHIEEHHPLLQKVSHTVWRFGKGMHPYEPFRRALKGLRALTWPGGEVRLVYVSKWRGEGYPDNAPYDFCTWVDNDLGALVYVGGKHAATIGFGIGADGVYLSQVQLRQKRSNRWLYKLPAHYLEVAVNSLVRAFECDVWLIDGASAVEAVRRSYGTNTCKNTPEEDERIAALYDRPLDKWVRTESVERDRRTWCNLQPR